MASKGQKAQIAGIVLGLSCALDACSLGEAYLRTMLAFELAGTLGLFVSGIVTCAIGWELSRKGKSPWSIPLAAIGVLMICVSAYAIFVLLGPNSLRADLGWPW